MTDVLVLRALGMGDLLTAVPALRGLRHAYPDARITLAAPAWLSDLVAEIDAVDVLLPTEGLVPLSWADPPPRLAVNLHGKGPQSTEILARVGAERLITHGTAAPWDEGQHEVVRWCRLLAHHGIEADPQDLDLPAPADPGPTQGAIVVHPGASHAARRWPPERYREVVRALSRAGAQVVVTGTSAEGPVAEAVAAGGARVLDIGLRELAALVAHARLVICGDTGMAHLATAYGTPSIVLFGPVPPRLWGPPPDRPQHRVLWSGWTGDTFADRPDAGLLSIEVADVLAAARGGEPCTGSESWARATSG
jgi:ADP-heptose:LPS heptosyltransferase